MSDSKKEYVTFLRRIRDLSEGQQLLFIKDLEPGPRKYDTRLVRCEVSQDPDELPDGHALWIRSETGYRHPQTWRIRIIEELPPYVPGAPWQDACAALKHLD